MTQKTIAIAAVLMAAALTGISSTTTFAYAGIDDWESLAFDAIQDQAEDAEDEAEDAEDDRPFLASDQAEERANAAAQGTPMTTYKIWVTLTNVPAGAEDVIVNATVGNQRAVNFDEMLVTSPSEGDLVKFSISLPKDTGYLFNVCGNTEDFTLSSCGIPFNNPIPTPGNSPNRVDFPYPS